MYASPYLIAMISGTILIVLDSWRINPAISNQCVNVLTSFENSLIVGNHCTEKAARSEDV